MSRKKRPMYYIFGLALGLFVLSILIDNQKVYAANWPVNQSESDVLAGHVHEKLTFSKNNSQDYTAVGDILTVTTEFTKLDDVPLDDIYDQSSAVVLYPDESQGLELIAQPSYMIHSDNSVDSGEFIPGGKEFAQDVIQGFNWHAQFEYNDDFTYSGVMTPVKITADDGLTDYDQAPLYSDQYSLKNILVKKGTTVQLSYQVRVTQSAIDQHIGKNFTFYSAFYDSSIKDYDFAHGFLTAEAPGIQALGVSFDESSKSQLLDLREANAVHLSGTWQENPETAVDKTLSVNGTSIKIPDGSFKDDGTFDMTLDLSSFVSDTLTASVTIDLKDENNQVASDTATLQFQQINIPPEIQLASPVEGATTNLYSSSRELPIELKWKDDDSDTVTLSYRLDDGTEIVLQDAIENLTPGEWQTYHGKITWSDTLAIGSHQVILDGEDSEGEKTTKAAKFQLNILADVLGFKEVDKVLQFPNLTISNQLLNVEPVEKANVVIMDTKNNPDSWRLMIKQTTDFSSGSQLLKGATLSFISGAQSKNLTNNAEAAELPVIQSDTNEYKLVQDEQNHFQLTIPSGNLIGDYSADIEWTIVEAP